MTTPTWFDTENQKYDVRPLLSYQGMKDELNDPAKASRHSPIALALFWGLIVGTPPYDVDYLPDETYGFVLRYWLGQDVVIYQCRPQNTYTYIFSLNPRTPIISGWYTDADFDRVINHFMESGLWT